MKAPDAIGEETLQSWCQRLEGNNKLVGRKAGRASAGDALQMADALNKARAKTGATVASAKTVNAFDKKRSRKSAAAVQDTFHAMMGVGVGVEGVPTCLACYSLHALMFVTLSDEKF